MTAHQARVSTGPVAGAIPPRVDDENVFNTVQDKRNLTREQVGCGDDMLLFVLPFSFFSLFCVFCSIR
jgi:hypothetical protein